MRAGCRIVSSVPDCAPRGSLYCIFLQVCARLPPLPQIAHQRCAKCVRGAKPPAPDRAPAVCQVRGATLWHDCGGAVTIDWLSSAGNCVWYCLCLHASRPRRSAAAHAPRSRRTHPRARTVALCMHRRIQDITGWRHASCTSAISVAQLVSCFE